MGVAMQGATYTGDVWIRNGAQEAVDPDASSLVLTIKRPDGSTLLTRTQAQLNRLSQGHFDYGWAVAIDLPIGTYLWNWDAVLDGVNLPDAVEEVVVAPAGSLGTTFVTGAQVRALVKTALSDDQLLEVIEREEAVLAGHVGALTGERTEVLTITEESLSEPIRLRRPTALVAVTEANIAITDVRLSADARTVLRLTAAGWASAPWAGVVEATYTPNDAALVATHVIELVRARLAKTGYLDEPDADKIDYDAVLAAAVRGILAPRARGGIRSVRMSTAASPAPAWIGSVRP